MIENRGQIKGFPFMIKKIVMIVLSWSLLSAASDRGIPLITNYHADLYNGYAANWAIVQDHRGIMYFGNGDDTGNGNGILEYDGVTWNLIPLPNKTTVRSLAISKEDDGKIFVGAVDDFGYLEADSLGQLRYISLLGFVDERDRNFGDVWETYTTGHGIYFITQNRIFRWSQKHIKVWKPEKRFHLSSVIRDTLYVRQWDVGLMRMEEDTLRLLPGSERFASERIYVMLPFDEKRILIGTRTKGLFLYDGISFTRFRTEIDNFLLQNEIYLPGTVLDDGTFAFGTMRGGLILMDREGKRINHIDAASGLQDNTVFFIYQDREGSLWLALNRGISKVDISSPFSFYTSESGIASTVFSIIKHNDILYIATGLGVYYLDPQQSKFNLVEGITSESWQLLSIAKRLLVATFNGVYEIKNKSAKIVRSSISYDYRALALYRSKIIPNRIYIGLENGLASLRLHKGKWIDEGVIPGVHEQIHSITETPEGTLWLGTNTSGLLLLKFENVSSLSNPGIKRFIGDSGLPDGGVSVFSISGIDYFATNKGLYRFAQERNTFILDITFSGVPFNSSSGNCTLREDKKGNVWINFGGESAVALKNPDGSYTIDKKPFLRFAKFSVYDIYPDEKDIMWFGGPEGLIRYDKKVYKDYNNDFPVLIRRITVAKDSLIFGGALANKIGTFEHSVPKLSYAYNALRIEFSASSYQAETENQFMTFLEGFDDDWSSWKRENKRDYTNLPGGFYRFHVQARNVYGQLSNEAVFEFKILPPWYFTWPAYILYSLIMAAGIFMVDRKQRKRIIKKERGKSQLREAELRAEAAEAKTKVLQFENERKKNIELLSRIGRDITATLSIENIINTVYGNINTLMDATVFGIGIHNNEEQSIEFPATIKKGRTLPFLSHPLSNEKRPSIACFKYQKEIFSNDFKNEYAACIQEFENTANEDLAASVLYLPLIHKEKAIGVITAQSYQKNAYTEYHLNVLRSLAVYVAIALDNAEAYRKLNTMIENLKTTQEKLVIQEKLASLGALTAGIAHEIKNPLNFINNFAELTAELVEESKDIFEKYAKLMKTEEVENLREILNHLIRNAQKINEHGRRADSIVSSMLQHSRGKAGYRQETDINAVLEEDLNLAYHGMRAQNSDFNITIKKQFDKTIGTVEVVSQDISRVFLNIITNGFYETYMKWKENGEHFIPTLSVCSQNLGKEIEIRIEDNGKGIPASIREKLFEPFFTTKPAGQGTGLGLSLSYDIIVKEHNGDLTFETEEGKFTRFIIRLPRKVPGIAN
jgi:signal transduction histidine kinase/ligand-binding sensor domain-containing protein